MSMENAILTHAAALDKLAAVIRAAFGGMVALDVAPVKEAVGEPVKGTLEQAADTKPAARANKKADEVKPDAELDKAVEQVEKAAKVEQSKPVEQVHSDDTPDLDYVKDVRPALLAAIKKAGKDKVQELVASFGVDKADKIEPQHFAKLLASAQKLAA